MEINEYKNVYGMITLDDEVEQLPIPLEIAQDSSIKSYKVMAPGEKVIAYYERLETPFDKPAKIIQTTIVEKPVFCGKWVDKTEEYLAEHKKERPKAEKESRPAIDKAAELRQAEELLRQLQARFGGYNE